jgi:hypothetical protein
MRWAASAAVALCFVAAGCGGSRVHATAHACVLTPRQRSAESVALRDIRRLHRLEAPLTTYTQRGTPALEAATNRFLLDLGRVGLPIDTRGRLLHLAKSAVGLCGLCFQALEAEEPVLDTRLGRPKCA